MFEIEQGDTAARATSRTVQILVSAAVKSEVSIDPFFLDTTTFLNTFAVMLSLRKQKEQTERTMMII